MEAEIIQIHFAYKQEEALVKQRTTHSGPPFFDPTPRERTVSLSVYRFRVTFIALTLLQVFALVCFQTGILLQIVPLYPSAHADLVLALVWTLFLVLIIIFFSLLFWEGTRWRAYPKSLVLGIQFVYAGLCMLVGGLQSLPATYTPLLAFAFLLLLPLGVCGTISLSTFLLMLLWDGQRGSQSRRYVAASERHPWDGSIPAISCMPPGVFPLVYAAEQMIDAWYELRDAIKRDALPPSDDAVEERETEMGQTR